jgi:hypothetical protein
MSTIDFYKNLKTFHGPLTDMLEESSFCSLPDDWHVIICDVKESTKAVNAGRHHDVNLVAAGSLIASLNIARAHKIEIPFFFGGDGGTVLVPHEILQETLKAVHAHNVNCMTSFGMSMHIGSISMKEISSTGHWVKIAKVNQSSGFYKSVVIGDGLPFAENMIKSARVGESQERFPMDLLNLQGLECRWDRIKPPQEENEVVCYLIEALDPLDQIELFKAVLIKADEIYGDIKKRNPLSIERLKLLLNFQKLRREVLAKYGKWRSSKFLGTYFTTFVGKLYFRLNFSVKKLRGRSYLAQVVSNADTLNIDGRLNTIISGKVDKRLQFTSFLDTLEKQGKLIYGHHISRESVMTCYIEQRDSRHIHFVDGADGGYTDASKELKRKKQAITAIT